MKISISTLAFSLIFLFTITACQESKYNQEQLKGTWIVKKWKIESTGKVINNRMDMTFADDGLYDINYGSESEKGKFWISGENLHTVETGKTEKTVKILNLRADTLEIQMNRAGQLENVLLLKK